MSTNTFLLSRNQVFYAPGLGDSGGRSIGISTRNDGSKVDIVLEWGLSAYADLGARVAKTVEDIPTNEELCDILDLSVEIACCESTPL